jgi:hypothetical protein
MEKITTAGVESSLVWTTLETYARKPKSTPGSSTATESGS